jgi:hypothetical protein
MIPNQNDILGITYNNALTSMQLTEQSIQEHVGIVFESDKAAAQWAKENMLDLLCLSKSQKKYLCVGHTGDVLEKSAWQMRYRNVLLVKGSTEKEDAHLWAGYPYIPDDDIRTISEDIDGLHRPLYHRDYFTPTGYYDPVTQTFNRARPFPVFAKETGADTSYVYEYIKHAAGEEHYMYLLAWLRAKLLNPKLKTEVTPIFVTRQQGTGKSTFGEVICAGLFGRYNVLITDTYDSQARFNADYADALIISQEEREEGDKRNTAASMKSKITATRQRKENKGVDPVYQASYTEYVITTNRDVPIKFEGYDDQRRFMIMTPDDTFTRSQSDLADEVFTKLYGRTESRQAVGTGFADDIAVRQQFMYELINSKELDGISVRDFPRSGRSFERNRSLPKTSEVAEIEAIMFSLAPFIRLTLENEKVCTMYINKHEEMVKLDTLLPASTAMYYSGMKRTVSLCRPLVFFEQQTMRPYNHATVERTLYDCEPIMKARYGIKLTHVSDEEMLGGFPGVQGRHKFAPYASFEIYNNAPALEMKGSRMPKPEGTKTLLLEDSSIIKPKEEAVPVEVQEIKNPAVVSRPAVSPRTAASTPAGLKFVNAIKQPRDTDREGRRLPINSHWQFDIDGEYETVNEMPFNAISLKDKSARVLYMDTFLLEADETSKNIHRMEEQLIAKAHRDHKISLDAEYLYTERLRVQTAEAERLFNEGIVCRVVYSGAKSLHLLVRVQDSPDTLEEYKWLHAYLALNVSKVLKFDPATSDPGRLTRSPVTKPRTTVVDEIHLTGMQKLLYCDWTHVYIINWRPKFMQWKERPLNAYERHKNRRLMPTRQEYMDAAHALINAQFWTSREWDGRRQQLFFPAYRICRMIGFSHDELWAENGILDGIENYYRPNEISYWRARESCALIQTIDEEVSKSIEKELNRASR